MSSLRAASPLTSGPRDCVSIAPSGSPSGNALVGFDFPIPGVSFLTGWNARIDADFILAKETAVPVTFDVLQSGPLNKVYFGAGLGMIFGTDSGIDFKLVAGTQLTGQLGGEANIHFARGETILTILARIHM